MPSILLLPHGSFSLTSPLLFSPNFLSPHSPYTTSSSHISPCFSCFLIPYFPTLSLPPLPNFPLTSSLIISHTFMSLIFPASPNFLYFSSRYHPFSIPTSPPLISPHFHNLISHHFLHLPTSLWPLLHSTWFPLLTPPTFLLYFSFSPLTSTPWILSLPPASMTLTPIISRDSSSLIYSYFFILPTPHFKQSLYSLYAHLPNCSTHNIPHFPSSHFPSCHFSSISRP